MRDTPDMREMSVSEQRYLAVLAVIAEGCTGRRWRPVGGCRGRRCIGRVHERLDPPLTAPGTDPALAPQRRLPDTEQIPNGFDMPSTSARCSHAQAIASAAASHPSSTSAIPFT